MHKSNMIASWGFIWQRNDEQQHAVPANRGAASIELAPRIQSNSCDWRLTLLWELTCTLRNCLFFTRAFITICSSWTLGIGCWQKSDIVCLWCVMNFRGSRYAVGGSLLVTDWAAEQRLASSFYLFELFWWKSVHMIYFKIRFLTAQTYMLVKM